MLKFMVHILLKPDLENFKLACEMNANECNCEVVWAFFSIAFLRHWNENWPFPVLWPMLILPNLLAYWMQHFHSERVKGRKARGLQMEEIGCKCQMFFISLISGRRKQTTSVIFFFPSLNKLKTVSSWNSVLPRWHLFPLELNFSQTFFWEKLSFLLS